MRNGHATCLALALALSCLAGCGSDAGAGAAATGASTPAPAYDDTFWSHWGDGRAELAGYDLIFPRYGAERAGTAVTIVVTEDFAAGPRVKHEDPSRPAAQVFPVVKLNLTQDFATGIYDYNLMTSAFVALQPRDGRPAGAPTKLTFSSQEWCGQAWSQVVFEPDAAHHVAHSYFDGEGDRDERLPYPSGALAEDTLLLWARGLAGPTLAPGERREVALLRSLETVRLRHVAAAWDRATIERGSEPVRIEVPAGTFEADVLTVRVDGATTERRYPPGAGRGTLAPRAWTFWVERAAPHRVVRYGRDDGLDARLLGSERLAYWGMNGPDSIAALERIGLRPRAPRTP